MSRLLPYALCLGVIGACGPPSSEAPPAPETHPEPSSEGAPGAGTVAEVEGSEAAPSPGSEGEDPPPVLEPHDVVVLVVHEEPLLRSETRILGVIAERLDRRGLDVGQREATDEEAAYMRAFFEGRPEAAGAGMPGTLAGASKVLVLRVPAPRVLANGDRVTRGIAGVLAFRASEREPYFEARVDDVSAWRASEDRLAPWLLSILRAEVSS